MKSFKILSLVMLFSICAGLVQSQSLREKLNSATESSSYNDSAVDLSRVAKLKIALRKQKYHMDEVILVNLGVLFEAQDFFYTPKSPTFELIITNENGTKIKTQSLYLENPLVREIQFTKVKSDYLTHSRLIIVGCHSESIKNEAIQIDKAMELDVETSKALFDLGVFPPSATSCINVTANRKYEIQATLINGSVNTTTDGSKTAVGRVVSNKVGFTVIK